MLGNAVAGKLKICVVGSSKYFFSGLSAHTIFLSNALATKNEVSVIFLRKLLPTFLYPGRKHLNKDNYLINLNANIDFYDKLDWNSPVSWVRASQFLRVHKPDAIIMLWWTSSVAHMQLFLALANKLNVNAKLILEMHEIVDPLEEKILPIRIYSRLAGKILMHNSDAFTVHSTSAKDQISKRYNINKNKIFVKPFGLYRDYKYSCDDKKVRTELGINENFIILSFGSVRKYKGNAYLVKAFSDLPGFVANNSRLIIAGEDWGDDDELAKLIEVSPYRSKITFNSHFVEDNDIPKYFSIADVVVLPYIRSCGSGVASIAMSYGKSIITSDIDTMRECLSGYKGARFAPVADHQEIGKNLLELFHLKEQGVNSIYTASEGSWELISMKYTEIIKDLSKR